MFKDISKDTFKDVFMSVWTYFTTFLGFLLSTLNRQKFAGDCLYRDNIKNWRYMSQTKYLFCRNWNCFNYFNVFTKDKNNPAKFNWHRHYFSIDIIAVYHVNLQDHVIKALYDFILRSLSRYITILPGLVAIGTMVLEIWF